jgi:2-polyprenyl-6-methoxyphenol hydroxylase-like FAD-dependent oxidoreductase
MTRRALVIGGSVGGLFAAALLREIGWDVAVFEKSTGDLATRGAGLGLSAELFRLMKRAGARINPSMGVGVSSLVQVERGGAIANRIERTWLTGAWSRIYRPLRDAVPNAIVHSGRTLERVEQDGAHVTAIFTDGGREIGDLLVGADGVHSTVRSQFLPEVAARYAGYVAWRGVSEERDLSPEAYALLRESIAYCFPEGEMSLSMPHPGKDDDVRAGQLRFYFIWYRPADEAGRLRDLMTDSSGRDHGFAIPPPLIRPGHIAAMKQDAAAVFAPAIAEIVIRTPQPLLQAVTDLEVPRLVFGRAALMGDAAFVARPHVAAGITKAALDAVALAESLAAEGDIDRALARYEGERLAFGGKLVAYSRYLGAASLAPDTARDPARVMREYGAPHLLRDADASDIG